MVSYLHGYPAVRSSHADELILDISVLVAVVSPATDSLGSHVS